VKQESNMKTMVAAAFAICVATPLFAQTPAQPQTSTAGTPTTVQPATPAQTATPAQPATSSQAGTPTQPGATGQTGTPMPQGASGQPVTTAQPGTQGQQAGPITPGAAPVSGTPALATTELGTAALLVERALAVLDKASNTKTGDVTLDRGLLDEVRAELSQVKATLEAQRR
jgi:hypothetical protein